MLLISPEQANEPENLEKVYEIIKSKNLVDCIFVGENKKNWWNNTGITGIGRNERLITMELY